MKEIITIVRKEVLGDTPYTADDGYPCKTIEERNYINLRVDRILLRDSLQQKLSYVDYLQRKEIPHLKAENTLLIKELQELNEYIEAYGKEHKDKIRKELIKEG